MEMLMTRHCIPLILAAALSTFGVPVWAQQSGPMGSDGSCAPVAIPGHYGPLDYVAHGGRIPLVEDAHFTSDVEHLRRGKTGPIGGDLGYTLKAIPNHHRALVTAMRYAMRERNDLLPHMTYPVSCYFDRATRFRPRDNVVRGLYAKYLHDFLNQKDEALKQLAVAVQVSGDNPLSHHNIGLLYFEFGEHAKAAEQAARAKELGYPREELIEKLKGVNHWPSQSRTNSEQTLQR